MKNLTVFLFGLILLLAVAGIALYYWYSNSIIMPNGSSKADVIFEVSPGDSVEEIADKLVAQGLLKDRWCFIVYGKFNPELVAKFQAGYFELNPQNSVVELFALLQKAKNKEDVKLTIIEGLRYDEIADTLAVAFAKEKDSKFDKDEFIRLVENPSEAEFSSEVTQYLKIYKPEEANLEGFLYPDTYFFAKDSTTMQVLEKLVATLFNKLSAEDYAKFNSSRYSFYELLTVASLIQREAFSLNEKPMIADIIFKRLEHGINGVKLLQIDASLLYPVKDWKADVYRLKNDDNPYNTYKYPGLPPSPICNPGIDAFEAALNPEANEYYYYLHDSSGNIHYAKTYSEHLSNINRYL
jgi:UPF0755 protein